MAEFYCDISAVGNEYQAYAATPTWGAAASDRPLPMDGTGRAGPGHSASVAIAELQITTNPSDGNSLSIGGSAALTAKTSATAKNQFTIGANPAATASALVALINTYGTGAAQCDATVSTSVSRRASAIPYFYFARIKPGASDTIQLVTRVAGADLNTALNSTSQVTQTGTWLNSGAASITFAEGSDGPFAYVVNATAVFGTTNTGSQSSSAPGYGLFFNASNAPSDPALTDVIHHRTRRDGVDLAVSTYAGYSGDAYWSWRARNHLFDDGTIWSGDDGTLTYTVQCVSFTVYVRPADGVRFESRSKYNFKLSYYTAGSASLLFALFDIYNSNYSVAFLNSLIEEHSSNYGNMTFAAAHTYSSSGASNGKFDFSGSKMVVRQTVRSNFIARLLATSGSYFHLSCFDSIYEVTGATGNIGSPIYVSTAGSDLIEWVGGAIRDSNGVYTCNSPVNYAGGYHNGAVVIDSVSGVVDPSVSFSPTGAAGGPGSLRWTDMEGPVKAFRFQTARFAVDWKNDGSFPYYGAAAYISGLNWSHRVSWTAASRSTSSVALLRLSNFYRAADAVVTVRLPLYVPDAIVVYEDEIDLMVIYTDAGGTRRIERTGLPSALSALATGRTALSDHAGWTSSGVAAHTGKKLELITQYSVKQATDVVAVLIGRQYRAGGMTFYASPELEFA